MSITIARGRTDETLDLISGALERYQNEHPQAEIALYRQNSVSVRIRIIDPALDGMEKSGRHDMVWGYLEALPEEVQSDISMVVAITPDEMEMSLANLEFEDPSQSPIK